MAFIGTTKIHIRHSTKEWTTKAIQELAGEEVNILAWNGHAFCVSEANQILLETWASQRVRILLDNDERLDCDLKQLIPLVGVLTSDPRISIRDASGLCYTMAKDLKPGDRIVSPEDGGTKHAIQNITGRSRPGHVSIVKSKTQSCESIPMYTLVVPGYNNFLLEAGILLGAK